MALRPCSLCNERFRGKTASAYWAWFNPLGVRYAKKQAYDPTCYATNLRDWLVLAEQHQNGLCDKCQEDIHAGTTRATYLNLYLPTVNAREMVFELCDICADELRALASRGADDLPNRQSALREEPDRVQDPWATVV